MLKKREKKKQIENKKKMKMTKNVEILRFSAIFTALLKWNT